MKNSFVNEFKNHELVKEYLKLMDSLEKNVKITELILKQKTVFTKLNELDKYCDEYVQVYEEYKLISTELLADLEYARFKSLEREINLFVMEFNLQSKKLFGLEKKGCKH